jgi:NAD-dependent DNA ligase
MELVNKYLKNPYDFLEITDLQDLIKLTKYADINYHNGTSIMSDQEYDLLIDRIKFIDPNNKYLNVIGSKINNKKKKVKLPYFMGSMNKIKLIEHFLIKYKNDFCISDKLDGISALLIINTENKLYTRGDGYYGMDISNLLNIINIDIKNIKSNVAIRGEIIITREKFKKYEKTFSNARNMVSGIINSKKIDNNIAKDLDFVAYELIDPWLNIKEQFEFLNKTNLKIVEHIFINNFTSQYLEHFLQERKLNSLYECDGIIVSFIYPDHRSLDKNPDYAFAFKDSNLNETIDVKVIKVEWNISKDNYIKPRLILEPTKLSGVIIKHVTGFNAKYIVDNKIGQDSIIKLIRAGDVIPHIVKVVKSTKVEMPEYQYRWTETGVDIIYQGKENREHLIKNLTWFCNKMEIEDINEGIISKFIDANIDKISKIINITKEELEKVENFKEKMITKIYNNIKEKIDNIDLTKLMIASNCFGHGIGEKRIKKILEIYPDILLMYIENSDKKMIKIISEIYGFEKIIAEQFINNIPIFLELINELPETIQEKIFLIKDNKIKNNTMQDIKIIFSGFRNKKWEDIIINKGGTVVTSISKNTTILVANIKDIENKKNSKIIKAIDLGIQILSNIEFEKLYIL